MTGTTTTPDGMCPRCGRELRHMDQKGWWDGSDGLDTPVAVHVTCTDVYKMYEEWEATEFREIERTYRPLTEFAEHDED